MSFEAFDVVVVPFPFTDKTTTKRRPALVLSSAEFNQTVSQAVMAMITSAKNSAWPLDMEIQDLDIAGLPSSSIVRMKLFTLDTRLVLRKAGHLGEKDRQRITSILQQLLPLR
ncbi:type II toxin-antitoxin system PemK/MazF family toxin [Pistricoccus aurantiacus]|uniref:type II toxin-antitoxin system PemK/MazF family toxin n=1 Tax=Pistricoccus aurantiacus TaxID=1883414 RepID=UPI00363FA897